LFLQVECINCVSVEKELISLFVKKYVLKHGNEYFQGDKQMMIADINMCAKESVRIFNEKNDKNEHTMVHYDDENVANFNHQIDKNCNEQVEKKSAKKCNVRMDKLYSCNWCGKVFKNNAYLIDHKNKKIPCTLDKKIEFNKSNRTCKHCEKTFVRRTILRDHIDRCKIRIKKENDEKVKQESKEKLKREKIRKKKLEIVPPNENILVAEKTVNVLATPYVEVIKNYDGSIYGSIEYIKDIYEDPFNAPIKIIKMMHCNKNKPEYHNLYIGNKQNKDILVKIDNRWMTKSKIDILYQITKICVYNCYLLHKKNIETATVEEKEKYSKILKLSEYDKQKLMKETAILQTYALYDCRNMIKLTKQNDEIKSK